MKEKLEQMKENLNQVKTITRKEYGLTLAVGVLLGIVVGFLFAPIKKGISCGNNNGNTTNNYLGDDDNYEFVDDDCDCGCDWKF